MDSRSLSIFFPCYNDRETIGGLVVQADTVARGWTEDYEVIVIDDGSRDNSLDIIRNLQIQYPRLRVVSHARNQGYGAALRAGFSQATKDFVFYTDGDGQYDVGELRNFLRLAEKGTDWVNGYRTVRQDPLYRIILGNLYQEVARLLFRFRVRDLSCDFRLIRRRVLETLRLHSTSGAICIEFVKKLERTGVRSVDYPVRHYPRPYGRSQFFHFRSLRKTVMEILQLWKELK